MQKLLIVSALILTAFSLSALTVDLSGKSQSGAKLICIGKTSFHADRKNGDYLAMNDSSSFHLEGDGLKDNIGFDLALQPRAEFTVSGKVGGKVFIMRYAGGMLLCRGEGSAKTALAPAYAWNNHETRYLSVRRNQKNGFDFFIDGVPALEQSRITIEPLSAKYFLELKAFGDVRIRYLASASNPLTGEQAQELFRAMVNRKPKQALPVLVIPEFRPPEGEAAFDEKNWRDAARITDFVILNTGKFCERQTVVLMGADAEGIYLYFRSPVIDKLTGSPMEHDEGFGGDSVEFFFMPTYTETFSYYQFIGNFRGSTYDSCGQDLLWDGKWTHHAHYDDKEWISVFRIKDFSNFAAPVPRPGTKWRFNVCRDWQSPKGWLWSEFSNTPGFYSNYNSFAHATYGGKKLPFFRVDCITRMKDRKLSAEFEAVNPSENKVELKAEYTFYAPGSINITEESAITIQLDGKSRKNITLTVPVVETGGGMVVLSIVNTLTGELLYKQAVIL